MEQKRFFWLLLALIVLFAAVLAERKFYFASEPHPYGFLEDGVACTMDAKLCPDGSYVGRTGPKCEFVCPSASSGTAAANGILAGKVMIGPICPVERANQPCPVPPQAYASREFLVQTSDGKRIVASFHADPSGSYRVLLMPGNYVVKSANTGMGFVSRDLPATVTIVPGKTTELNINVDTGIR